MPRIKRDTVRYDFSLPKLLDAALEWRAGQRQTTKIQIVTEALENYLRYEMNMLTVGLAEKALAAAKQRLQEHS